MQSITILRKQLMYFCLTLMLFCYNFSLYATGTVVFLHGTSCAGKTSICSALATQDSWKVVDEDTLWYQQAAFWWHNEFPQEFSIIAEAIAPDNIFHALMRNQILFKLGVDEEQQTKVRTIIDNIQKKLNTENVVVIAAKKEKNEQLKIHILETIKKYAQNFNIIVDTWLLKPTDIEQIQSFCSTINVLAYCPFNDLVKRILIRNNKALLNDHDISSMRFFHQALKSYMGLFEFSHLKEGAIDCLSKIDALHALNFTELAMNQNHYSTGASQIFTRGEFSTEQFQDYKKQLLAKFKDSDELFVIPKITAHLIRTDQCTPEEAASVVNAMVHLRKD